MVIASLRVTSQGEAQEVGAWRLGFRPQWIGGGEELGRQGLGPHRPAGSVLTLPACPLIPRPGPELRRAADIRPFGVPNPTPAIPKPTTARCTSSEAAGREPRAPFAPVRRARGAEVTPQRWAWSFPETPGRLPGSGL